MSEYKHTQSGRLLVVVLTVSAFLAAGIGLTAAKGALLALPTLALAGWLFHSLTIEITETELRWCFGSGFIHKRVPLEEVVSARPVRTSVMDGWGIHWGRYGWLYNVSGSDAVAITLRSGKRFALGTDEPESLAKQLGEISIRTIHLNG